MIVACLPEYIGITLAVATVILWGVTLALNRHTRRIVKEMRRNNDRAVRLLSKSPPPGVR